MEGIRKEPFLVTKPFIPESANLDFLRWLPVGTILSPFWGRNDNVLISRKKFFLKEYYFLSPFAHWINDRWNFLTGQRIFNLVPLKTVACPPTFNLTVFWFKLRCSYIWFTLALISGWGSSENGRKKSWILIWINTK